MIFKHTPAGIFPLPVQRITQFGTHPEHSMDGTEGVGEEWKSNSFSGK
jgi:hypothetical protein